MKKLFLLIVFGLFQFAQAQNPTSPTGTSTEVGITEGKLSVSLSGAATYNIPIAVPPGLNGVVPQISLSYSSQGGNGIAGYGWNISGISAITRIPSTKYHDGTSDPVDFDSLDRFALDGQRLIVKNGTTGVYGADGTVYETENFSNVKITSYGVHPSGANYGPAYFVVEYPVGSVAHYGEGDNSRTIMSWGVDYWKNPQQIVIDYLYNNTENNINNNLIISIIKYGSTGVTTPITVMGELRFNLIDRNRKEQYYVGGQLITDDKKLDNITVYSNALQNFRKYELAYQNANNNYDKLISVTEKSGANFVNSLNPTVFDYGDTTTPTLGTRLTYTIDQTITSPTSKSTIGDFDGDGNSDFIFFKPSTQDNIFVYKGLNAAINPNVGIQSTVGGTLIDVLTTKLKIDNKIRSNDSWTNVVKNNVTNRFSISTYKINDYNSTIIDLIQTKESLIIPSQYENKRWIQLINAKAFWLLNFCKYTSFGELN
jgi:hypothetical protein